MKTIKTMVMVMVICLCVGIETSMAQTAEVQALDIAAIKNIQMVDKSDGYYLNIVVIFENSSDTDIQMNKVKFDVKFREKEGKDEITSIKEAFVETLVIPKRPAPEAKGEKSENLELSLGPKNEKTMKTLVNLFNIIGNPSAKVVMILVLNGEIETKVQSASKTVSISQPIKATVEFEPKLQREILFK